MADTLPPQHRKVFEVIFRPVAEERKKLLKEKLTKRANIHELRNIKQSGQTQTKIAKFQQSVQSLEELLEEILEAFYVELSRQLDAEVRKITTVFLM